MRSVASPRAAARDPRLLAGAAGIGLALVLVLQFLAIQGQSLTGDEAHHLLAGHQALRYGANLLNWEHPPLAKLVGALPTLREAPLLPPLRVEQALPAMASLYRDRDRLQRITIAGRGAMLIVFGLPLLVACAALGRHFGGAWAGLLLALMLGLAFPFVPFLAMVLTDAPVALAAQLTLLAAIGYATSPSPRRAALGGLALGLGLVTKFTAVLLLPTAVVAFSYAVATRKRGWLRLVLEPAIAVLVALAVVGSVYAAANRAATARSLRATAAAYSEGRGTLMVGERLRGAEPWLVELAARVPAAGEWLTGLLGVRAQSAIGVYQCYLFGRVDSGGFRWYFPAVIALKTPLAILVTAAALAASRWRAGAVRIPRLRADAVLVVVTVVVYLGAAIGSSYDIGGVRHLLPIAPMLLLPLAVALARRPWLGLGLVAALAIESLALSPLWLAATNTWWLGDRNPARFAFSHGDLEYRQSFVALATAARERGARGLRVLYPGLPAEALHAYLPAAELIGPGAATPPGWYAVSVLVEQFVPAILRAQPAALGDASGLRRLARGYRPLWRRVRRGEDHGWVAGTFHLYRLPETAKHPGLSPARPAASHR